MTRNETITLIQTILVMYPSSRLNPDPLTVAIWHEMLKDLDGEVVSVAVRRMGATLKYPPSIADIREAVTKAAMDASGICSAGDAWAKVRKAMSRWGCYRGEQARSELGEEIWRAVEMVGGWQELCLGEGDMTITSAQFERRYKAMIEQQEQLIQIPSQVREDMRRLTAPLVERMLIEAGPCSEQKQTQTP